MSNQLGELSEMLRVIGEFKTRVAELSALPRLLIVPDRSARTAVEVEERNRLLQHRHEANSVSYLNAINVVTSKWLPKQYECVGHTFNNPPPAKNRSLRLWKKLRYGLRRGHVRPVMEERDYAFLINEDALRSHMLRAMDDITYASMCGVISNIGH